MRIVRTLEILLGAVFTVTAAGKALDWYTFAVQVSAYGVVREPGLVSSIALTMVGIETLLAVLLLSGLRLRGLTLAATGGLLLVFSGLILYGWIFHNLQDCGCFGAYLKMGPGPSLAKNGVMLVVTVAAAVFHRRLARSVALPDSSAQSRYGWVLGALGVGVIGVAAAFGKSAPVLERGPLASYSFEFEGQTIDLGTGEYLVAMLSATCEHCQAAVEVLNTLASQPGAPRIVALMLGNEQEMDEFRTVTSPEFPNHAIDALQFMNLIGNEPPRFYIVRDGKEQSHLDVLDPTPDDLLRLVHGG